MLWFTLLFQILVSSSLYDCVVSFIALPRYACKEFSHYWSNRELCEENLDIFSDLPSIVTRAGYSLEQHTITTDDGYILTLFRIPALKAGAQPVLGIHGIGSSALHGVSFGNDSLGFVLHNQGYDVWMPSLRGVTYSRGHMSLTNDDFDYWNYNLDTIAKNDISKCIEYVYRKTNKTVIYMGFSMGTTLGAMYASKFVEQSQRYLKGLVLIAPVLYTKALLDLPLLGIPTFIIKWMKKLLPLPIELIKEALSGMPFLEGLISELEYIWKWVLNRLASLLSFLTSYAKYFITFACTIFPTALANVVMSRKLNEYTVKEHLLLVASIQEFLHPGLVLHFSQMGDNIQEFDYGLLKNWEVYNENDPPTYNLSRISIPAYLFYGNDDIFSKGVEEKFKLIGSPVKNLTAIPEGVQNGFRHYNFASAKNIGQHFHRHLLAYMGKLRDM